MPSEAANPLDFGLTLSKADLGSLTVDCRRELQQDAPELLERSLQPDQLARLLAAARILLLQPPPHVLLRLMGHKEHGREETVRWQSAV